MKVTETESGNYVIHLGEVFDFKKVEEFRKCYEPIDAEVCKAVDISFKGTRYMDSSALGMLLNIKNHFKVGPAKIKITNTNDQINKILQISRFDQRFHIEK